MAVIRKLVCNENILRASSVTGCKTAIDALPNTSLSSMYLTRDVSGDAICQPHGVRIRHEGPSDRLYGVLRNLHLNTRTFRVRRRRKKAGTTLPIHNDP